MTSDREQVGSILIFRALKLGDMLCCVPALRALRRRFPKASVSLIGHPALEPLLRRYPEYVDEFIPFPGHPGMPEILHFDPKESLAFIQRMQERRFDLSLQLHGSGELSNALVALFHAKHSAGHYRQGQYCPTQLYRSWDDGEHELRRCLQVLRSLGAPVEDEEMEFPLWEKDFEALKGIGPLPKDYACLHPGASSESKRWSPAGFASVADLLFENGFMPVFTGSASEAELTKRIQGEMRHGSIDTASLDLPLGSLAALISGSRGLICNDTGASHLAAALKVPSLVIFSETDPRRWAPLNRRLHRHLVKPELSSVLNEVKELFIGDVL